MARFVLKNLIKGGSWTLTVPGEPILVGRSKEADLCIRDTSVSKRHCRIERRGSTFRFKDLGSRNGTFINDLRTNGGPLEDGDELRIGNFAILFYREDGALPNLPATQANPPATQANPPATSAVPAAPPESPPTTQSVVGGDSEDDAIGEETIAMPAAFSTTADSVVDDILGGAASLPDDPNATATAPIPSQAPPEAPGAVPIVPVVPAVRDPASSPPPAPKRPRRPSRSRPSPEDGLEGDEEGRPAGRRLGQRSGMSTPNVVLCCLFTLIIGVALGVLLGRTGSDEPPEEEQSAKTPVKISGPKGRAVPNEPVKSGSPKAPPTTANVTPAIADEDLDPTLQALVGPRANLLNRETSHRAMMRLFLDVLDRSPTRAEAATFQALSHEDRWSKIRELAQREPTNPVLTTLPGVFNTLLGRLARRDEQTRLMKDADGSIERLGFIIASSRYYAGTEHTRDRSLRKRSRAFWVDLLDAVPSVDEADIIRRTLENPQNDLQKIVRTLIYSPKVGPEVAPSSGGSPGDWVDATYLRFLLRLPRGPERNEAVVEFGRGDDGWRRLLLDLGLRQEYARY